MEKEAAATLVTTADVSTDNFDEADHIYYQQFLQYGDHRSVILNSIKPPVQSQRLGSYLTISQQWMSSTTETCYKTSGKLRNRWISTVMPV
jgi:hypothetical protein